MSSTVNPDQPFAELVTDAPGSPQTVLIKQLAVAINKAAWWLDERLRHLYLSRTFAFVSSGSDIRYWILMVAGAKTGRLAFFPSPRNDTSAHSSLFQKYGCKILLLPAGSSLRNTLQDVIEVESLACLEVPDLNFFFSFSPDPTIATEPLVGLHTSGSTGVPKPVKIKHGNAIAMEKWKQIPELGHGPIHFCQWPGKRVLLALPLFHLAAINIAMAAIQNRFTLVFPPAGPVPVNAPMIADIIKSANIDIVIASPSILAEMAADRKLLDTLSRVQYAAYGGGPLPENAGEAIRRRTGILSIIGMSETGILPCEIPDDRDWQYTHFSPVLGIEMRPAAEGLFDLMFVRNEANKDYQVAFFTYPELTEYGTGDLFAQHPTKPGLWQWKGRNDDIVVYSTGEKFNPTAAEDAINGNPLISAALVAGQEKPHPALLVEPAKPGDAIDPEDFIEQIWPHVRKVNSSVPAHSRIMKDMILVTNRRKPLRRAGKGTVQRNASFRLYEEELEELYEAPKKRKDSKVSTETISRTASLSPPLTSPKSETRVSPFSPPLASPVPQATSMPEYAPRRSSETSKSHRFGEYDALSLARQILDVLKYSFGLNIAVDGDFFSAGVDSLGVTTLVRELQRLLPSDEENSRLIAPKVVYEHPTPIALASYLCGNDTEEPESEVLMQQLFEKYTADLPITARNPLTVDQSAKVVILTGSTGSFGTYLLDALLRDERPTAEEEQVRSLIRKGLSASLSRKPVTFAVCDLGAPYLGLESQQYKDFLQKATHVIHNAWNVNFNLPLHYFEKPHIQGVRQLVDFSARSAHGATIFFISSIGAVANYEQARAVDGKARPVPEVPIEDWSAASLESGYGQSELVSERILAAAAASADVPCAICRLGQIAGPSPGDGEWQRNEWLPTLVVTSRNMDCLPQSLGSFDDVDWVPIDLAAQIVLDFVQHSTKSRKPGQVQNSLAVHKTAPFSEWIDQLAKLGDQDLNQFPALKLVTFFRSLLTTAGNGVGRVKLDTTESQRASWTLAEMKAISGAHLQGWIRRWF
ncbi:Adenylate-forming reductase [Pseudocercospora fuligena]|uniref:Adenylate-forming reductase n=1 Tax=Pseudocercospora fuligena TaxID=685502 RepID=A0A8H6RMR8_9PEZI|nr:Adenylate-forming reductase [Pseudocercospora fuligena]